MYTRKTNSSNKAVKSGNTSKTALQSGPRADNENHGKLPRKPTGKSHNGQGR